MTTTAQPETFRLLRDENCPRCDYPETWAEVTDLASTPTTLLHLGCSRCDWRQLPAPDAEAVAAAREAAEQALTALAALDYDTARDVLDNGAAAILDHQPALVIAKDADDAREGDEDARPVFLCPVHGREGEVQAEDTAGRWNTPRELTAEDVEHREVRVEFHGEADWGDSEYLITCPLDGGGWATHYVGLPEGWDEVAIY